MPGCVRFPPLAHGAKKMSGSGSNSDPALEETALEPSVPLGLASVRLVEFHRRMLPNATLPYGGTSGSNPASSSEAHRTVGALARRRRFLSRCPSAKITRLTRAAADTASCFAFGLKSGGAGCASLSARGQPE